MKTLGAIFLPVATVVVAFFFAASLRTEAANVTWTNTVSGGWNTAANWDPHSVPGATDTAIITNAGVTVSLNGATTVGGIILGTNGAGTVTLSLAGQTLSLNGPLTVNPSGSFTVDSGALIGNTNALLTGTIGWTAASLGGVLTLASGGTLNITTGNNHNLPSLTFTNNGTVAWSSGTIIGGTGTAIYNYGLWDAQSDQSLNNNVHNGNFVFNNYGTFRKSAGTGSTVITGGVFNQLAGVIDVQNGTNGLELAFQGGGNFTGGYITTNQFGWTVLSAGNFTVNGTVTGTNTWQNAGNLVGTNVINGALTWVGGNWNSAVVTIAPNCTVIVAGGDNNMVNSIVTNNGTVAWASGTIIGGTGTAIYNYGLWDAQSDQRLNNNIHNGNFVFNNYGTVRKSAGTGSSIFEGAVTFNNTGKMDVQDGNIALQGAYTLANGTQMGFGLGGWLGNGSISLSGAASFSGSVSVNINGYFWPAVGGSFNLLNYTSESGVLFTNAVLAAPFTWQTNYNAKAFTVTVVARPAYTNTASTNLYSRVVNGTTLYIAWPGDHTGWSLQAQTNSLDTGLTSNWTTVPGSSVTNEFFMPLVKTNGAAFFRMTYP